LLAAVRDFADLILQSLTGGLLGAVFDQDGDGQLGLGDLLKIGEGMLGSRRPA